MGGSLDNEVYRGISQHIPQLRRYARSLTRDRDRADDLLQESLTRALSKSHLYRQGTNLRAWLFTILHRQHISTVRQERRTGVTVAPEDAVRHLSTPPRQEMAQVVNAADGALSKLPEDQRQAIEMVSIDGMSYGEAADLLHVSTGTVKSRVFRGRAIIKQAVDGKEATGPDRTAAIRARIAERDVVLPAKSSLHRNVARGRHMPVALSKASEGGDLRYETG